MLHMEHDILISDHPTEAVVTIKHRLASCTCRLQYCILYCMASSWCLTCCDNVYNISIKHSKNIL